MAIPVRRSARLAAVSVLLAGATTGLASGVAAAQLSFAGPAASLTVGGSLDGVAAWSPRSAWAVGHADGDRSSGTVILRWNGTAWKRVRSPSPAGGILNSVAVISAGRTWAVGCTRSCGSASRTLIEGWNGRSWQQARSPAASAGGGLDGVAAVSARSAWAVGTTGTTGRGQALILRWNGSAWKRASSPDPEVERR